MNEVSLYAGLEDAAYQYRCRAPYSGRYRIVCYSYCDLPNMVCIRSHHRPRAYFRLYVPVVGVGAATDKPVVPVVPNLWAQMEGAALVVFDCTMRDGDELWSVLQVQAFEYMGEVDVAAGGVSTFGM